jgi:hypothetical protein
VGLVVERIELLRPAFHFLWFATIVAGMTVRADMLGVTSIVRALNLRPINVIGHPPGRCVLFRGYHHNTDSACATSVLAIGLQRVQGGEVRDRLVGLGSGIGLPYPKKSEAERRPNWLPTRSRGACSAIECVSLERRERVCIQEIIPPEKGQ